MRRNKHSKLFWIIIILIALSSLETVGSLIAGLAAGFIGLGIVAIAIAAIVKLLKRGGYIEPERDNRPSANPYSQTSNKTDQSFSVNFNADTNNKANPVNLNINGNQIVGQNTRQQVQQPKPAPKPEPKPAPKPVRPSTGDPELDKMVEDKDQAIAEMQRLNKLIEDPTLSDQIDHLESVTDKIVSYVVAHPKKKKQVGKFFSYYLPTTLKLLNAYARMDEAGISGANIDGTKEKVEEMMGTALSAFDKQLDALFAEEALDVSTDISVMENMLKAEGLMDDSLMNEAKELVKSYQE